MMRFKLDIEIIGPFMATGVEAIAHGVDAPFLRDHNGKIILPGSQIRGLVRHAMGAMASKGGMLSAERVERLLGRASAEQPDTADGAFDVATTAWQPQFGEVEFSDLYPAERAEKSGTMTRIAIDGFTGAVKHGSLQVLEQPIGLGEKAVFSGSFDIRCADGDEETMARWIEKALCLVPAIGAHKSSGFGRVAGVKVTPDKPLEIGLAMRDTDIGAAVKSGLVDIAVEFDGPFLVSSTRWNTNLFSGSADVPGGVLKAVLGRDLGAENADHPLHECLSGCVVSELRPANQGEQRPQTPPVSLYYVGDGDGFLDDAILNSPEDWASEGELISFATDWKYGSHATELVAEQFKRSFEVSSEVRTRTAINKAGTADTGKLFTYSAVNPDGYVWKGRISKGKLNDAEFEQLLRSLPGKLFAIGKTRVSASLKASPAQQDLVNVSGGDIVLVLETDACLHTPDDLFAFEGASSAERLRLQYQAYFASALRARSGADAPDFEDPDLKLTFFATQRRAGGYVSARYAPSSKGYYPWLLTVSGSVFRFSVPKGYESAVESFVCEGLPLPAGFDGARKTWRGNPYVPENGYGEVRVHKLEG